MPTLIERIRRPRAEDRALTAQTVPPAMLQSVPGGEDVTPRTALRIADAWACIRALSDAAASLPLVVYRRTGGGRVRIDGDTATMLRHPAPATTQAGFIGQLVCHLQLYGNAYIGKARPGGDGEVRELVLLPPERVRPELKAGLPLYTVTDQRGRQTTHTTADVIHVRALTTDGVLGLSPIQQCRTALGLSSKLAEHAAKFFENDARPSGVLKLQAGSGTAETAERLADTWHERHGGLRNAHRIAVVAGELDFVPLSVPPDDLQFLEQRELSAQEVARIFRVPPWIVGAKDGGSLTYSNTEQQAAHFVTFSLRPWLVVIEQALSADVDLFPAGSDTYCEFLLDALLRSDAGTRAEVYTKALNAETGWMTRAEVRSRENLDPERTI